MFNRFIPFELIILFEMCKIHYSFFIAWDLNLWEHEEGEPPLVHNLSLLEDCAEIRYLFCDKTGTLTQNVLIFRNIASRNSGQNFPETEDVFDMVRCILLCNSAYMALGKV